MDEEEFFFGCPYCWSDISMLFDLSIRQQTYIEDCEVCCNPIEIHYQVEDGEIVTFDARSLS